MKRRGCEVNVLENNICYIYLCSIPGDQIFGLTCFVPCKISFRKLEMINILEYEKLFMLLDSKQINIIVSYSKSKYFMKYIQYVSDSLNC